MNWKHRAVPSLATLLFFGGSLAVSIGLNADETDEEAQAKRDIQTVKDDVLARVGGEVDPEAAAGYAVFDTTKGGLIVTGAGGTGVAHDNDSGEETYMHLGGGGVGLGAGLENYQLLLVFNDDAAYDRFVDGQWSGSLSGQAVAGDEGIAEEDQTIDDVEVHRFDEAGLIAQADVSGIRFWPSEDLNEGS